MKHTLSLYSSFSFLLLFSFNSLYSMDIDFTQSVITKHPELTQSTNIPHELTNWEKAKYLCWTNTDTIIDILKQNTYHTNLAYKNILCSAIAEATEKENESDLLNILAHCANHKKQSAQELDQVLLDRESYIRAYQYLQKKHLTYTAVSLKNALRINNQHAIGAFNNQLDAIKANITKAITDIETEKNEYINTQQGAADKNCDLARTIKRAKSLLSQQHKKGKCSYVNDLDCSDDEEVNPSEIKLTTEPDDNKKIMITEDNNGNPYLYDNHRILAKIKMHTSTPTVLDAINKKIEKLNAIMKQLNDVDPIQVPTTLTKSTSL